MPRYRLAVHPAGRGMGIHDPSAAIFEDEQLVYGAEEERFVRIKHAEGCFPEHAVRAALDHCEIGFSDVDEVVIPWHVSLRRKKLDRRYLLDTVRHRTPIHRRLTKFARYLYWSAATETVTESVRENLATIEEPVPEIRSIPHHRCHAVSAFYPSGFDEATILTIDGEGEYDATVVWKGDADGVERRRTYKGYNSLGGFYGAVTEFLGFRAYNGEGKVMGLAPYGEVDPEIDSKLRSVIEVGVDYDVSAISAAGPVAGARRLESILDRDRYRSASNLNDWDRNLARTAQTILEEIVTSIATKYCSEARSGRLCLAGGVALNCKLNKRLMELDVVENVFIQPVAHDAGTVIGAGLANAEPERVTEMSTVYTGTAYDQDEIVDTLDTNRIPYRVPEHPIEDTAEALADGELVGWFDGRFEFGPRALGARSILADPRSTATRDQVNNRVKHRESWRPFAPSMLRSAAEDYLVNPTEAPFMIRTFDVDPAGRDEIPAVLHPADDTTRPQTVRPDQNPRYHALIKAFGDRTGVPVLLNTSFNDKGEPIVNTPQRAIKDFYGMGLDRLVLGDVVVDKVPLDAPR